MGAREKWIYKEGDRYFEHSENDGWAYLRNGAEAHERELTARETIKFLEDQLGKETRKNGQNKST